MIPTPSTPRKLSWPDSPVTQLKYLWLDTLSETERDYWREQFATARPQSELRQELLTAHNINLLYDIQLTRFRRWIAEADAAQDARDAERERAESDVAELQAQGLTTEQIRHALLDRMKIRALVDGDFQLGVAAINVELRIERNLLNQRKFDLQERRVLADEKQRARATQPGGITPEVLAKIERELNLL